MVGANGAAQVDSAALPAGHVAGADAPAQKSETLGGEEPGALPGPSVRFFDEHALAELTTRIKAINNAPSLEPLVSGVTLLFSSLSACPEGAEIEADLAWRIIESVTDSKVLELMRPIAELGNNFADTFVKLVSAKITALENAPKPRERPSWLAGLESLVNKKKAKVEGKEKDEEDEKFLKLKRVEQNLAILTKAARGPESLFHSEKDDTSARTRAKFGNIAVLGKHARDRSTIMKRESKISHLFNAGQAGLLYQGVTVLTELNRVNEEMSESDTSPGQSLENIIIKEARTLGCSPKELAEFVKLIPSSSLYELHSTGAGLKKTPA